MAVTPTYNDHTALLVVDVQNDFADPSGSLYVASGEDVVPVANREAARARATGAMVAYSCDWHPPETPHFQIQGGIWPVHCVRETWGAQFHPDLKVDGELIHKATGPEDGYSAFSVQHLPTGEVRGTGLQELMAQHQITKVVVVGIATDYCVRETALDALRLGYQVEVLREGIRAVDLHRGDGVRAIAEIERGGARIVS
jgi:nicotinamidase/pyrazinamidase